MAYRRVLVGTDGSPTAVGAVRHAAALAAATSAELVVVTASDGPGDRGPDLAGARAIAAEAGVGTVHARTEAGDPAEAILRTAEELLCDVVVVGNRGMAGAGRLLGSVPASTIHRAPCDVLIVPTT